jgi:hypothetical protein
MRLVDGERRQHAERRAADVRIITNAEAESDITKLRSVVGFPSLISR